MNEQLQSDIVRDLARLGLEQYDKGFDACCEIIRQLYVKGTGTDGILYILASIQLERGDITERAIEATVAR